ncbi:hypothetical protein [Methylocystis sp. Sn-Cys]|uniref:hypothetical protein n=1 Tax=Methylocystis sp. Sn-Cys TaxID=1701263 RepID=UPI001924BD08|nr:hypothetical protein [Methylocystis sp. Sn-Cys]
MIACLLAIQNLSYAAPADFGGDAISHFDRCSQTPLGDDGQAPSRHHQTHCWAQCCQGGGRNGVLAFIARLSVAAILVAAPVESARSETPPFRNDPPRRQSGWASSWSSRAPPDFL